MKKISRSYKTEAVVLNVRNLSEKDRIATLITPTYGKLDVVVKGSKKLTGKISAHFEPINRLFLMISSGRNLDVVSQSELLFAFPVIRSSLSLSASALYLADLVNRKTEKGQENRPLFRLFLSSLNMLEKEVSPAVVIQSFCLKLITVMGYRPTLDRCILCGKSGQFNLFDFSHSGLICPGCSGKTKKSNCISLSPGAVSTIIFLEKAGGAQISRLKPERTIMSDVEKFTRQYIKYHLTGTSVEDDKYKKLLSNE